jgi:predicted enzyme related to lactoylglutathione lyase
MGEGAAVSWPAGYIPGVPCWVDASEPDPEAALDFYGGLFGWEFENVMRPSSGGQVLHRPVRGDRLVSV